MNISVENKSRTKKVPVKVKSTNKSVEKVSAGIAYCEMPEDPYSKKNLAEQLALLTPKEMRKVVSAARHLRKFKDLLTQNEKKKFWDDDEDESEFGDEIWEEEK